MADIEKTLEKLLSEQAAVLAHEYFDANLDGFLYRISWRLDFPEGDEIWRVSDGKQLWDDQVRRRWDRLSKPCLEAWKATIPRWGTNATKIFVVLPAAIDDANWLAWCVDDFAQRASVKDGFGVSVDQNRWLKCIEQFSCWTDIDARKFFEAVDTLRATISFETATHILSPGSALTGSARVCMALTILAYASEGLTKSSDKPSKEQLEKYKSLENYVAQLDNGNTILRVFSRLQELPTQRYDTRSIWSEFGPDAKAAWRTDIIEMLAEATDLRHGLIEHVLWRTRSSQRPEGLYSEMELLVLGLCRNEEDVEFLETLKTHVSRLVCVRAAALLVRLCQASAPSPFTPLPEDGVTAAAASHALTMLGDIELPCRTWMQDRSVERVIYAAVHEIEAAFSVEYESLWRLDEEMHLATLLARLQGALRGSNGVLDALAAHGVGMAPHIDFSFRQITKHEEGAAGIGSDRFSVDLAFIIRVTDMGKTVTERAALVQCKKLEATDRGVWKPTFEFRRDQCDDLIRQTESSFYMFLSPACIGREVWMTPARLVRNLADLGSGKGRLPHLPTYFASRSLAHWVTYDLFGL